MDNTPIDEDASNAYTLLMHKFKNSIGFVEGRGGTIRFTLGNRLQQLSQVTIGKYED